MFPSGLQIGEHVLVRRVASGAMSEVYEGRHVNSGHPVAVKVLSPEWCLQPEVVARFLNEARALQRLRHARIVKTFACGTLPEGAPFMILEWLPVDLHQVLSRAEGPLSSQAAVRIAWQLADALAALHDHGLVHRDLKPANVLLARDEPTALEIKLADLGLAKVLPDETAARAALPVSTGGGTLLGTWDYMAPEQWIQSKSVDPRADVYALGVLLFQLLTGRLPFIAEQQKDLMYLHLLEPPPLELLEGRGPVGLRTLLTGMLGKKPSQRPTMHEVLARLAA